MKKATTKAMMPPGPPKDRMGSGYLQATAALRSATGIVIPVYFPAAWNAADARRLVAETVEAFLREVADPHAICLSADGPGAGAEATAWLSRRLGVHNVCTKQNRGKLNAVRLGMQKLLKQRRLNYLAVADQDGDHFANELINLVRAAQHVQAQAHTERVMALGRRVSRHRALGLLRGELEELADRMLLDALHYDAAKCGRPLALQFCSIYDEFPDFHSGFKLFTRRTAAEVFAHDPDLAGLPEEAALRHACDAVMSVEAVKSGAIIAAVNRSTYDEQPLSTFGLLDRRRMVADKIIWPCRRLDVPPAFVAQWMDNHLPRLLLSTLVPEGRNELLEIRRLVFVAFGLTASESGFLLRPRFI